MEEIVERHAEWYVEYIKMMVVPLNANHFFSILSPCEKIRSINVIIKEEESLLKHAHTVT